MNSYPSAAAHGFEEEMAEVFLADGVAGSSRVVERVHEVNVINENRREKRQQ